MKHPFSYKHPAPSFRALLLTSFLGHLAVVGGGSWVGTLTPRAAVKQAPHSVEVVMIKEIPRKEEPAPELRLLSVKEPFPDAPKMKEKKQKRYEEKRVERNFVSPQEKGALEETREIPLKNLPPVYPARAREEGWEGAVVLKVRVGPDGSPQQVDVFKSSGYRILDEAALKAVRRWQFLPARAGGIPFSSWIKIPVRFRLIGD